MIYIYIYIYIYEKAAKNGNQNRQTFLYARCQIIFILCITHTHIHAHNTECNCAKKTIDHWQEDKSFWCKCNKLYRNTVFLIKSGQRSKKSPRERGEKVGAYRSSLVSLSLPQQKKDPTNQWISWIATK